jgi:hypothetical protein
VQPEHLNGDESDEHGEDAEVHRERQHHHDQGGSVTFRFESPSQGCHGNGRTDTSVTSDKALVCPLRNIRAYLSIFEHILENIQRICQLRPIANGQDRLSVRTSHPYTTGFLPRPSSMTTLVQVSGARFGFRGLRCPFSWKSSPPDMVVGAIVCSS